MEGLSWFVGISLLTIVFLNKYRYCYNLTADEIETILREWAEFRHTKESPNPWSLRRRYASLAILPILELTLHKTIITIVLLTKYDSGWWVRILCLAADVTIFMYIWIMVLSQIHAHYTKDENTCLLNYSNITVKYQRAIQTIVVIYAIINTIFFFE